MTVDREGDAPFRTVYAAGGNALTLGANAQAHPDTQTLKAQVAVDFSVPDRDFWWGTSAIVQAVAGYRDRLTVEGASGRTGHLEIDWSIDGSFLAQVTPGPEGSGPMHRGFLQLTELFAIAPSPVGDQQRTSLFETSMDRRGLNANDARVESFSDYMDYEDTMLSWIQGDPTRREQVVDVGTRTQTLVVPFLTGAEFDIGFWLYTAITMSAYNDDYTRSVDILHANEFMNSATMTAVRLVGDDGSLLPMNEFSLRSAGGLVYPTGAASAVPAPATLWLVLAALPAISRRMRPDRRRPAARRTAASLA